MFWKIAAFLGAFYGLVVALNDPKKVSELKINGEVFDHMTGWIDSTKIYFEEEMLLEGELSAPEKIVDVDNDCAFYDIDSDIVYITDAEPVGWTNDCPMNKLANRLNSQGAKLVIVTFPYENELDNLTDADKQEFWDVSPDDLMVNFQNDMKSYDTVVREMEKQYPVTAKIPIIVLSWKDTLALKQLFAGANKIPATFELNLPTGGANVVRIHEPVGSLNPLLSEMEQDDSVLIELLDQDAGNVAYFTTYQYTSQECQDVSVDPTPTHCSNCFEEFCIHSEYENGQHFIEDSLYRTKLLQESRKDFLEYTFAVRAECSEENFVSCAEKHRRVTFEEEELISVAISSTLLRVSEPTSMIYLNEKLIYDENKNPEVDMEELLNIIEKGLIDGVEDEEENDGAGKSTSPNQTIFLVLALILFGGVALFLFHSFARERKFRKTTMDNFSTFGDSTGMNDRQNDFVNKNNQGLNLY